MKNYDAIVIGTSAGGMDALSVVIPALPKNFSLPVIVVQHLDPNSELYLCQILKRLSQINIEEACEKQKINSGNVYLAPPNYHLLLEENKTFSLSFDEKVQWSRPSIDVLFESAAEVYQNKLIGVLLTGANSDGSAGLKVIKEYGGLVVVQDPSTASAPYMPQAAINSVSVDHILELNEVAPFLSRFHTNNSPREIELTQLKDLSTEKK